MSHSPRPTALIAGSKNIMRRLWEPVTFAVKNGAHCGDDAWLRKGQVRRSHSPPQAALIAGIFPAPSNSSDSCLIRRQKRRSLRALRCRGIKLRISVSFAATSGAHCGFCLPRSSSISNLVSFAATGGAHCGMAAVDPNLAELLSHSPRQKTISLRMDSTFQRPKTISLRRKTVSPMAKRDCPKAKTISPEVKMVSQAQDQDSQSANSIPVR